jgi:hypothetical protein
MDEFSALASTFVPAAFNSGNFPLPLTPPPRACPTSGTFDLLLTLPHYYGGAVNVSITTDPPGLASVIGSPGPYVYWDTSLAPALRKKEQTIRVACSTLQDLTTVSLAMTSDSDTFHYSLAEDSRGFTVSQTLPPSVLRLNFSSPLLQPLNGAQVTAVDSAPFASPLVVFDGYSSFLDLNTADDTGVQPQAALGGLNIPEYLQSPDPTGLLQIGWSAEGWYQALSLAHPATVFSCGQSAASEVLTTWSGTSRTGPAIRSIVVSVSGDTATASAEYAQKCRFALAESPFTCLLPSLVLSPLLCVFSSSVTTSMCMAMAFPLPSSNASHSITIGMENLVCVPPRASNPSSDNGEKQRARLSSLICKPKPRPRV